MVVPRANTTPCRKRSFHWSTTLQSRTPTNNRKADTTAVVRHHSHQRQYHQSTTTYLPQTADAANHHPHNNQQQTPPPPKFKHHPQLQQSTTTPTGTTSNFSGTNINHQPSTTKNKQHHKSTTAYLTPLAPNPKSPPVLCNSKTSNSKIQTPPSTPTVNYYTHWYHV